MSVERIDSLFNTPQIQQEFAAVQSGLADSQKALVDLFNTTKQFKDTSMANLASNTEKLTTAITGSVQATSKAKQNFDNLTNSISAQVRAANENATALTSNSQAYDQLIKQAVRNKISLDELSASQKALKTTYQAGTITLDEYQSSLSDISEAQLKLKTSNQDVTKTLNNLEKQAQASGGSLNEMRATLNLLVQSYDKLSAAEQQSEGGQSLQKTIQQTTAAVTELEVGTGRSQRKVGDYTGALKVLEAALVEVNAKLEAMTAAGQQNTEAFAKSSEESELLTTLVGQQAKGFSSLTMETRSAERALQTLRAAGFGGGEAFENLRENTVEATRAQKEFQRQQKLLEGEAPALGALILAAKGLGGAYAIGAGAAQLFASDNEHVQKELNKLVAIMTLLQGLNEAYATVQQFGAIATALKEAQIKALTFSTEAYTAVTGEAIAATGSLSAALVETGIGAVLLVVGAGIAYLVTKLVELAGADDKAIKMQKDFAEANEKLNDTIQKEIDLIAKSNEDQISGLKSQLELMDAAGLSKEKEFAALTKKADLEKDQADKAIKAATEIALVEQRTIQSLEFQAEKKRELNDLNEKMKKGQISLLDFMKETDRINSSNNANQITAENALAQSRDYHKDQAARGLKELADLQEASRNNAKAGTDDSDKLKKHIESVQARIKYDEDAETKADNLIKLGQDTTTAVQKNSTDITKFNADERRKIILESANLEADYIKNKNAIILADEKSTLDQRLKATQSNADQERKIIEANKNNVLSDPGASSADKLIAIKKAAEEEKKVTINNEVEKSKITEQFYQKERDAALASAKQLLEDDIKNNDVILSHDKARYRQRIDLQAKNYEDQRAIIGAQMLRDLDDAALKALDDKKQNEARLAIQAKYQTDLLALNIGYAKMQEDEQKKERDRQLKDAADAVDMRKNAISGAGDTALIGLDQATSGKGLLAVETYNKKRKDIEFQTTQDILLNQINADYAAVNSTKEGTKERTDAEAKLSHDVETFSANRTRKQLEDHKKLQDAEFALAEGSTDLIKSAIDDRYENELNHIQKIINANEKLKERETERISNSTLSEQEKANALIILNARAAAQTEALARQQRKLKHDEAVADKAFNVAKAIEEGILATLHALTEGGPVLAAIVGATAAISVAQIIATPIPAYKTGAGVDGKPVHSGGLALLHKDELIIEPGKSPYMSPGDNALMDLAPHTRVIPAEKIAQMTQDGMFVNRHGMLKQGDAASEMRGIKDALVWQTQRLESALAKQKKVTVVHNHIGTEWGEYIQKSVYR